MSEMKNVLARALVKTVEMTGKIAVTTVKMTADAIDKTADALHRNHICTVSRWQNFFYDEPDPMARIEKYFRLSGATGLIVKYFDDKKCWTEGRRSVWIRATLDSVVYTVYTQNINEKILVEIRGITPVDEPIELGFNIDGKASTYWRGVDPDTVDDSIRETVHDMMNIIS